MKRAESRRRIWHRPIARQLRQAIDDRSAPRSRRHTWDVQEALADVTQERKKKRSSWS
jgi:hypothetical protein